jgi:hypothetical protein
MVEVLLDGDVLTRARSALTESPIFALRHLNVVQAGGRLLISGQVRTFYHKQLAQEVVRQFADGMRVVNSVEVAD